MSNFFAEANKLLRPTSALLHISDGLYLKRITIGERGSSSIDTIIEKTEYCVASGEYFVCDYNDGVIVNRYNDIFSMKKRCDGIAFNSIKRLISFPDYALEDCLNDINKYQLFEHNVAYYWLNLHITVTVISLRAHNV